MTQSGFAELNGTKLYYEMVGEGHPLVLIHGGLVNRNLWDDQFDVFAQHFWTEFAEVFKKGDISRAVELTLQYWTDGLNRKPEQVDAAVRERVRAMTTRNYKRPDADDEIIPQPQKLEPPAISLLSEIHQSGLRKPL